MGEVHPNWSTHSLHFKLSVERKGNEKLEQRNLTKMSWSIRDGLRVVNGDGLRVMNGDELGVVNGGGLGVVNAERGEREQHVFPRGQTACARTTWHSGV